MIKIFLLTAVVALLLVLGYFVPVKTVTIQGCPGADYTLRHNLILGDTIPKNNAGSNQFIECSSTVTHKLYLL